MPTAADSPRTAPLNDSTRALALNLGANCGGFTADGTTERLNPSFGAQPGCQPRRIHRGRHHRRSPTPVLALNLAPTAATSPRTAPPSDSGPRWGRVRLLEGCERGRFLALWRCPTGRGIVLAQEKPVARDCRNRPLRKTRADCGVPSPGSARPSPGSARPSPGSARPSPGSARPSPGSARPSPGSARPSPGSARPSPGSARPSPGSARPSPGSARPSPGSARHRPAPPAYRPAPPAGRALHPWTAHASLSLPSVADLPGPSAGWLDRPGHPHQTTSRTALLLGCVGK